MKFFIITLVFVFFLSINLISEEIKVIELHDNKENELKKEESSNEVLFNQEDVSISSSRKKFFLINKILSCSSST